MTKKGEKLTLKQETFVSEYLKTGNATEAARRAGYKGNDVTLARVGAENLRKPLIAHAIAAKNQKRSERLELEEDFELKKAIELLQMCMEPKHVYSFATGEPMKDGDGNYVMQFDSKGANTALQTIAKLRGKFVQKVQVGFADSLAEQLEDVDE